MAQDKYRLISILRGHSQQAWHQMAVRLQVLSASICLVLIICYVLSSTRGGVLGTTELFSGHCNNAVNINRVLQAVAALAAIGISVSFDFFTRLASSPTVDDLREAHNKGWSFDIAVCSLRNLRQIARWRISAWFIIILLAIPIQLFFHSITFVCFSSTSYSRFFVSEAFMTGQTFAYPGIAYVGDDAFNQTNDLRSQFDAILPTLKSASTDWDKLGASECNDAYSNDPESLQQHRNLLLVVETGPDDGAEGWTGAEVWNHTRPPVYTGESIKEYDPELVNSLWTFAINCDAHRFDEWNNKQYTSCDGSNLDFSSPSVWYPMGDQSNISALFVDIRLKYCLSEPYSAPCKVFVSNLFLLVTMLCIIVGCTCSIVLARFCWHEGTCQSVGDALQTFLKEGGTFVQKPYTSPAGCNLEGGAPSFMQWTPVRKWKKAKRRWGQAVGRKRWLWTYIPISVLLLGCSSAIVGARYDVRHVSNDYPVNFGNSRN